MKRGAAYKRGTLLVLLVALACSGCAGYRVGNVSGRNVQGVRSVYVPVVRNTSLQPDLQVTVTNAIIRRFNDDGTLEVNQDPNADSELDVTITDVHNTAVASSTTDLYVTAQYQVTITGIATFVNRKLGRKIFENVTVTGSTNFFTQADIQEGERQALPLAAQDLAQNAVKLVTEGW
ncbi:MAG: LPS assembly lipoprotein LptE [Methylacidiphilales bacterium]|nr:LPS assembly lipoprotein LptE [Candidatus Methylacidiphilales bacterium]